MNTKADAQPLSPCPLNKKNCVSTVNADNFHKMNPIPYQSAAEEVLERLIQVINRMEGSHILAFNETHLKCEFKTKVMKFKDFAEFFIDDKNKLIHFRSEAEKGLYDFGVNRKRMDHLIHKLQTY